MNWKAVQIEREKNMGDYDVSSLQAAAVPAWQAAGGLTVPLVGMKPSRMRRQRHLDPSYRVCFGSRQTQEQQVAYIRVVPLAGWPIVLTDQGMTAGVASRLSAAGQR
jgi:hypothetical protein